MSIDISKHPLIKQAHEVCQAIEKCGASTELTDAVTKASALMQGIANAMALLDKWQQESSTWQSVAEKQLAIAIEAEKRIAEQREVMRSAANDIAYAIFNLTGSDLTRLRPGVVETTDPTDTALIAERSLRAAAGISVKGE
ncbi:MAG: hypothetical protein LKI85_13090 [Enterobacter sp.]|jgi:hypothetical protein|nr:hypothetical protein [Enterobacter sp.]